MIQRVITVLLTSSLFPAATFAQDTTTSPLMEKLASSRNVHVTDAQLDELKTLQLEATYDALGEYKNNFALGLESTQPGQRIVGRALTVRYLPPRPDLREALEELAEEGGFNRLFYGRAHDEAKPGDILVADVGGASGDHMFGDMGVLGMKTAGLRGAIVDGGTRDRGELTDPSFSDFPVFVRYYNIESSEWLGAEWNVPVRIGRATVVPGDIVIADDTGVLFIPPHLVEQVLAKAGAKVSMENFQREMLNTNKYRFGEVYPTLSPELQEEYDKRTKPKN